MSKLPKDCSQRIIGAEARKLVHYQFSSERWEYHEETGLDHGRDCIIELVENEIFTNKKIEGQIKGTRNPKLLNDQKTYSFPLDIKTINYGLSSATAFVLFYVLVEEEMVLYLPIQDYFIADKTRFDRLEHNASTLNVHIPCDNILNEDDFDLQEIAKSVYINGPSRHLYKLSMANRETLSCCEKANSK